MRSAHASLLPLCGLILLAGCGDPDPAPTDAGVDSGSQSCVVTGCTAPTKCDAVSGQCLLTCDADTECGLGEICVQGSCESGCRNDTGCDTGKICANLECVSGCRTDSACALGSICSNNQCVPGCSPTRSCPAGESCCGDTCKDLDTDVTACGGCNAACPVLPFSTPACVSGSCSPGTCAATHADCNGDPSDGCEAELAVTGACLCAPGSFSACYSGPAGTSGVGLCAAGQMLCDASGTGYGACLGELLPNPEVCGDGLDQDCSGQADDGPCLCTPAAVGNCYSGPVGTAGIGLCREGTRTCDPTGHWGPCGGDITPVAEICSNAIDEDCNGAKDGTADLDADGWSTCDGDCCDDPTECATPALVNPGAFEVPGNGQDDDCDLGTPDTANAPVCSAAAKFTGVAAQDLANALDLCQVTTLNPPLWQKRWGLLSAEQLLADGTTPSANVDLPDIQNFQTAVLQSYGTGGVIPTKGATLVGLSTGRMRDQNDPDFVDPGSFLGSGTDFGRYLSFVPLPGGPLGTYLSAHGGGLLPGACAGTACLVGSGANDSLLLRLRLRVPTNALSLSYNLRFFSAEYQTYQCTEYNDYFLASLQSTAAGIPPDRNISFDALGNAVSVNNSFFQACGGNGQNCNTCPLGTGLLAGTGLDGTVQGGGTAWLTTSAPVVPGEIITLDFVLFDVEDTSFDSNVLLDNFRWSTSPASVNTHD